MQAPTARTILSDFDNVTVEHHGTESRFFRDRNGYRVRTAGADGEPRDYAIAYTFGHYPLQQYLVDIGDGRLQALNLAWDSRPAESGGQRWFHLHADDDISPEHPFYWTRHLQNANSRCIECHATGVKKNFDPGMRQYATSWQETGVGCESCHGPGQRHVELAADNRLTDRETGFPDDHSTPLRWTFAEGASIATPAGEAGETWLDTCGACHSRRSTYGDVEAGARYHDRYRIATLDPGLYFHDGQIMDEVFVTGSFLQSKMQRRGVTCGNCHDPHSGKTVAAGNALCAQCHLPAVFDNEKHHRHQTGSTGAQCVECHMPERTYMTVDPRRDHSFPIPDPARSLVSGTPNACTACHRDQSPAWAAEALQRWGVSARPNRWADINRGLVRQDALVFDDYARAAESAMASISEATLTARLAAYPSPLAIELAMARLSSPDPLLRRTAVEAIQAAPLELRWRLLNPLIEDPLQTVRHEVAIQLADALPRLSGTDAERLNKLVDETRDSLAYHADSPTGQVAIGNLELKSGYPILAERAFERALEIEPAFLPALINLADLYRAIGVDGEARELLKRALATAPDNANAHHAYGLYLVRAGNPDEALHHLEAATRQQDANPRHVYVYAVALDSRGHTARAIEIIERANQLWPNQADLHFLQVSLLEKTGKTDRIQPYLSVLARIAPDNAQVRDWLARYGDG